jgi:3-hydroxyacyl-CoA dehydrogenase
VQTLFALGRHGQKAGVGTYRYEGRSSVPDPELTTYAVELTSLHFIAWRGDISEQEIVERLLYP